MCATFDQILTRLVLHLYQTGTRFDQIRTRLVPDWYHIRTTLIADSNQIGTIMPCGAMWCGVVFRGGGVLELVIGFSGFYLQLYRDSNSSPLRFEANAMLLYNAHPVRIRTKG